MKRRGNMMLSSSSSTNSIHRHESTATATATTKTKTKTTSSSVNHKSIGCMSGIFHLVSRYQHRRKLLTNSSSSSEKREKCNNNKNSNSPVQAQSLNPKSESQPAKPKETLVSDHKTPPPLSPSLTDSDLKRFSFDSPRSPTIPSEIRLSVNVKSKSNVDSDNQNQQRSPALVARLMGLDDFPPTPSSSSSPSEKRRKLMVALEKCDEDLKTLKNIIDTIRSTNDNHNRTSPLVPGIHTTSTNGVIIKIDSSELRTENVKDRATSEMMTMKNSITKNKELLFGDDDSRNGADSMMKAKTCSEFNSSGGSSNISDEVDQPSPISVLELISSPPSPLLLPHQQTGVLNTGEKFRKKLREEGNSFSFFQRTAFESLPRISGRRLSSEFSSTALTNRSPLTSTSALQNDWSSTSAFQNDRCKKEKVEIVNEACLDVVCGERWELGRIGVILEDYMFNELIQETVRELLLGCCSTYTNILYSSSSLPSGSCKKKLCF
ncbi:hypothetical protein C5167_003348 [Papaver somniferum]|uniref:DUF3741 domain-containing protein n=1 Tax=Papaver somniferum TaxID=3469 RepID=A0A4Y7L454_PAPSO|nr:uncharacterized protein LOC113313776 [Papaver somniferum]RZC79151.1 hypothetical protein C5167_003348 [Papaver somniferum]